MVSVACAFLRWWWMSFPLLATPFMAEIHAVIERRAAPRRRLLKSGKIALGAARFDFGDRRGLAVDAAEELIRPYLAGLAKGIECTEHNGISAEHHVDVGFS